MKTIQPFTDSSKIQYSLPAPAYTSTESNMLLKEKLHKEGHLPDLNKNSFDYRNHYSGISDVTGTEDDDITNHK